MNHAEISAELTFLDILAKKVLQKKRKEL